jgi:hypothetical protein
MYIFNLFLKNNKFIFKNKNLYKIYIIISSSFYYALFFNKLYNLLYLKIFNFSYLITSKYIDKGILEILGPYGLYRLFKNINNKLQNFVAPLLFYYLFFFFFSLFIFLTILIIIIFFDISLLNNNISILILLILILYNNLII